MSATGASRQSAAPLLIGALIGSLLAGRGEVLALAIACAVVGATVAGAGWPSGTWLRALAFTAGIALALNLYLVAGTALPLPRIFGAAATWEGLRQGAGFASRLIAAAIALHGLRAAWPGEQAADELADRARGLERFGVPVRRVRALVGLAIRFVPMLSDEARRIAGIQNLRAGAPARGVGARLTRLRALVVPALVASLERAGQVALALEARHYRMREPARMPRAPWGWRMSGWAMAGVGLLWR